jgi:hypothetical protein
MIKAQDQALLLRSFAHSRFATLGDIVLGYYEDRPSLRTVLSRRRFAARAFWRHCNGATVRTLAVAKQFVATLMDAFAAVSRLDYSVLRQRAMPASPDQLERWSQVWAGIASSCCTSADAPDAHRAVPAPAPAVHRFHCHAGVELRAHSRDGHRFCTQPAIQKLGTAGDGRRLH